MSASAGRGKSTGAVRQRLRFSPPQPSRRYCSADRRWRGDSNLVRADDSDDSDARAGPAVIDCGAICAVAAAVAAREPKNSNGASEHEQDEAINEWR